MSTSAAQIWNPSAYKAHAGFVPALGKAVLDLVDVAPPARVLDLGCGDGVLSAELVARGYRVRGVDASPEMVAAARARGIDAALGDGEALGFTEEFEVVFSNATLHWLKDVAAALGGVARALVPGGVFVAECGGAGNVQSVQDAVYAALAARGIDAARYDPWIFPSAGAYATALQRAGFRVDTIAHFDRPTPLPGDVTEWLGTFGQAYLSAVALDERPALLAEIRARVAQRACDSAGRFTLDYVRLRFHATKR